MTHRHKTGLLNTEFQNPIGKVAWHVPCHQRVQNIGPKTRQVLELVNGESNPLSLLRLAYGI